MKLSNLWWGLVVAVVLQAAPAAAQERPAPSARRAFALSLVAPGLGHRYVQDGSWRGAATVFALADAALWLSLAGNEWRRADFEESYRTLAATAAGARSDRRDRAFYLNLASYRTSDAYVEALLRDRSWDLVAEASDPANRWAWATDEDYTRFRNLREKAESRRRQRPLVVALLVGNRLLSGVLAVRAANRVGPQANLSLAPPPPGEDNPLLRLDVRF